MSILRVGQRVRVKFARTKEGTACVGKEATIVGALQDGRFWLQVDGVPTPTGGEWRTYGDQLEPLTDCYDKVEWSECLWAPEGLATT